jgi:hypothetical protein
MISSKQHPGQRPGKLCNVVGAFFSMAIAAAILSCAGKVSIGCEKGGRIRAWQQREDPHAELGTHQGLSGAARSVGAPSVLKNHFMMNSINIMSALPPPHTSSAAVVPAQRLELASLLSKWSCAPMGAKSGGCSSFTHVGNGSISGLPCREHRSTNYQSGSHVHGVCRHSPPGP